MTEKNLKRRTPYVIAGILIVTLGVFVLRLYPGLKAEKKKPARGTSQQISNAGAASSKSLDELMSSLGIQKVEEDVEAPDFELDNLEGKKVRLKDYRGKIVFLNFWATWCPPCRKEMPSMRKLYRKFKEEDFIILAVDLRESLKQVKSFMQKYKLTFPALLDSAGRVGNAYQVRAIPTTYLLDRQGRVVGRAVGARDWAGKEATALIEALLAEEESS